MICIHFFWKTEPWDIFARVRTAKCITSFNHDGSLEDNWCILFFKLKFLIPTLRHIFCLPKASKIYFESSVSQNMLGKYAFLWFKKDELFYKFFSSKYYFPSYISPLNARLFQRLHETRSETWKGKIWFFSIGAGSINLI